MIRSTKPKLALSISTATSTTRPSLSLNMNLNLKSPGLQVHSPRSPLPPSSPATSKRFSTLQVPAPNYNYTNTCSSKSILKKQTGSTSSGKRIQFQGAPTVHCITPIENADAEAYYGSSKRLSREERRWIVRND
ncbi:hypothetical protein BJY04DRAFT_31731 [Aspergillus karnatakaensis]|uniref:uncharacterized protein n=1 Tax=Aspergillus karnatakaensis TaxID=1810916 RepID=UPI003CCDB4BE